MSSQAIEPAAAPEAGAERAGTRKWSSRQVLVVAMLLLIMLSNYLDRLIMTIVQEPIKLDMGLSDLQLGLITGPAFGIIYALSAIPIARLAERYDRITILSVSLTVWSGFTALTGAAATYFQMFLTRIGVGMSEGGGAPSMHSLVSDYFPPRQRGFAIAVLGMSMPLAGFIAPLAGAYVTQAYGWRWAFAAIGIPGIIVALVTRLVLKDPRKEAASSGATAVAAPEPSTFWADMKWLATSKAFIWIFTATAAAASVMTATLLFTASFMLRKYGMTLHQAGIVLSLGLGLGGLVGSFLGGWGADRFAGEHGRSYLIVPAIGVAGAGALYFMAYSVNSWTVTSALVIVASIFDALKNGPNFAVVQTLVPPRMRATGSAVLMLAVTLIGSSVGPPMVGVISDWVAGGAFPAALGHFAEQCNVAGGHSDAVKQACAAASSQGLQTALQVMAALYVLPLVLWMVAAKQTRLQMD